MTSIPAPPSIGLPSNRLKPMSEPPALHKPTNCPRPPEPAVPRTVATPEGSHAQQTPASIPQEAQRPVSPPPAPPEGHQRKLDELFVYPEYYYASSIPVFKPTYEEFSDFCRYVKAVERYGRIHGIVKIIPPQEWLDELPKNYQEQLDKVLVTKPIYQSFSGKGGVYKQTNVECSRNFTVKHWWKKCTSSKHLPPYLQQKRRPDGYGLSGSSRMTRLNQETSSKLAAALNAGSREKPAHKPRDKPDAACPSGPAATGPVIASACPSTSTEQAVNAAGTGAETPRSPQSAIETLISSENIVGPLLDSHDSSSPDLKSSNDNIVDSSGGYLDTGRFENVEWLDEYGSLSFSEEYCKTLERNYWMYLSYEEPMYGADMSGTLTGPTVPKTWNMNGLGDLLGRLRFAVPGVNTPYLYFGMWKATFAWHVEDMDLYSINFLHFGAPKQWYSIPPKHHERFERLARGLFSSGFQACPEFLRHKTVVIDPSYLERNDIPVNRLVQQKHEFVITFPHGYHAGYNLGFNCAESVNFALESWAEIGKRANHCKCVSDSVRIDALLIERMLREPDNPNFHEYGSSLVKMDLRVDDQVKAKSRRKPKGKKEAASKVQLVGDPGDVKISLKLRTEGQKAMKKAMKQGPVSFPYPLVWPTYSGQPPISATAYPGNLGTHPYPRMMPMTVSAEAKPIEHSGAEVPHDVAASAAVSQIPMPPMPFPPYMFPFPPKPGALPPFPFATIPSGKTEGDSRTLVDPDKKRKHKKAETPGEPVARKRKKAKEHEKETAVSASSLTSVKRAKALGGKPKAGSVDLPVNKDASDSTTTAPSKPRIPASIPMLPANQLGKHKIGKAGGVLSLGRDLRTKQNAYSSSHLAELTRVTMNGLPRSGVSAGGVVDAVTRATNTFDGGVGSHNSMDVGTSSRQAGLSGLFAAANPLMGQDAGKPAEESLVVPADWVSEVKAALQALNSASTTEALSQPTPSRTSSCPALAARSSGPTGNAGGLSKPSAMDLAKAMEEAFAADPRKWAMSHESNLVVDGPGASSQSEAGGRSVASSQPHSLCRGGGGGHDADRTEHRQYYRDDGGNYSQLGSRDPGPVCLEERRLHDDQDPYEMPRDYQERPVYHNQQSFAGSKGSLSRDGEPFSLEDRVPRDPRLSNVRLDYPHHFRHHHEYFHHQQQQEWGQQPEQWRDYAVAPAVEAQEGNGVQALSAFPRGHQPTPVQPAPPPSEPTEAAAAADGDDDNRVLPSATIPTESEWLEEIRKQVAKTLVQNYTTLFTARPT